MPKRGEKTDTIFPKSPASRGTRSPGLGQLLPRQPGQAAAAAPPGTRRTIRNTSSAAGMREIPWRGPWEPGQGLLTAWPRPRRCHSGPPRVADSRWQPDTASRPRRARGARQAPNESHLRAGRAGMRGFHPCTCSTAPLLLSDERTPSSSQNLRRGTGKEGQRRAHDGRGFQHSWASRLGASPSAVQLSLPPVGSLLTPSCSGGSNLALHSPLPRPDTTISDSLLCWVTFSLNDSGTLTQF